MGQNIKIQITFETQGLPNIQVLDDIKYKV